MTTLNCFDSVNNVIQIVAALAKTDSLESIFVFIVTERLLMWMIPTLFPIGGEQHNDTISQYHGGLTSAHCIVVSSSGTMSSIIALFVNAAAVSVEACMTYWTREKGLPGSPESLYSVLLMCYALVPILKGFSVIIPASWVVWFTNAQAARTGHAPRDDVGDLARNAATNDPYGLVFSADYL